MIAADALPATGLIQPGSLIRYHTRVVLAPEAAVEADPLLEEVVVGAPGGDLGLPGGTLQEAADLVDARRPGQQAAVVGFQAQAGLHLVEQRQREQRQEQAGQEQQRAGRGIARAPRGSGLAASGAWPTRAVLFQ